jgi:riboflavin biosynthesis pyrimidine reductase
VPTVTPSTRGADPDPAVLESLWDAGPTAGDLRGRPMPRDLAARYGGRLEIPVSATRPTVLVNFVTSLDGIVALGAGEEPGGGVISGYFEPDRFVMALLRAIADVLVVGAGTIAGTSSHQWTAAHLEPGHGDLFRRWRRSLGLAEHPTTVIVTGSGELRLGRRGLDEPAIPVVVATTERGARVLAKSKLPSHVRVEVAATGTSLGPDDLARLLATMPGQIVLSEGGPHLLGGLVAGDLADELYLTVAPQVLGRPGPTIGRLGLVEGVGLEPAAARWFELTSVKRASDHLFLRYRRRVR